MVLKVKKWLKEKENSEVRQKSGRLQVPEVNVGDGEVTLKNSGRPKWLHRNLL